tara:strand:- start:18279 stop:19493 length:1215 start_codon:yes stop_codon:yes gene_type:complete
MMRNDHRHFPLYPNEITCEFLEKCFGAEVKSFDIDTSMTAGGVLADAFRVFNIEFEQGNDLPRSCFVKCTKEIPEVVELCLSTQVYAKEVYFYSTLINKVKNTIRVPECYAIFRDESDKECKEFCLVLEDFSIENWTPFDQFENPMDFDDTVMLMKDLGAFHAACWNEPISNEAGLGPYKAHWQSLNDSFWDEGTTAWHQVLPKWKEVYNEDLLSMVDSETQDTILRINEIYNSKNAKLIQQKLIEELQNRPRTITHGDARGNNIFKSNDGKTIGIIDWQMWAAGPASNEFSQLWFNSYSLESGMIHRLEELTKIYYESLTQTNEDIKSSYPFDQLFDDTKLIFINMWIQYIGFTLGSIDGYKDPEQEKSKQNWREMMKRNMETVHYSGCLDSFENFISQQGLG